MPQEAAVVNDESDFDDGCCHEECKENVVTFEHTLRQVHAFASREQTNERIHHRECKKAGYCSPLVRKKLTKDKVEEVCNLREQFPVTPHFLYL